MYIPSQVSYCVAPLGKKNINMIDVSLLFKNVGNYIYYFLLALYPIPIPAICANPTTDVYDSARNYVKSLCLVKRVQNYAGGSYTCNRNKMTLYNADTSEAKRVLVYFVSTRYAKYGNGKKNLIHINGVKGLMCNSINDMNVAQTPDISYKDCRVTGYSFCEFLKFKGIN